MVSKAADSRLFLFHKIGARLWRGEFIKRGFGKAGDQQAVRVAVDLEILRTAVRRPATQAVMVNSSEPEEDQDALLERLVTQIGRAHV